MSYRVLCTAGASPGSIPGVVVAQNGRGENAVPGNRRVRRQHRVRAVEPAVPGRGGEERFGFLAWRFISYGRWLRRFNATLR